jgi:antitoxin CptB
MELNQLRWRCRRGMRELDLILTRFLDHDYPTLDSVEQQQFAALLDTPDPDLYNWLLGRESPRTEFAMLIKRLQGYLRT